MCLVVLGILRILLKIKRKGDKNMTRRKGFGSKDGSKKGFKAGGRGRNRTSVCRHPKKRS